MADNEDKQPGHPALTTDLETALADERVEARQEAEAAALASVSGADAPDASEAVRTLIEGSSPDDAARLSQSLGLPKPSGTPRRTSDELADDWRSGGYPYRYKMLRRDYERQKFALQTELLKLQSWVKTSQQRAIILFEGRDAAGKGGAIKRFMEHLNPRGARVVALEKPSDVERGQWYFQRYVRTCPPPARSCCSTAPGTTAPASSASWAFAATMNIASSCARPPSSSATWCAAAST